MGQTPVKTQDSPGFILNYFLIPFNNDAIRLVEAGVAAPADIDRAIKTGLGYAMGPLELLDLVGLDTHLLVAEALYASTHDPRAAVPALVKRMIAAGKLGRKTGEGFYKYQGSSDVRRLSARRSTLDWKANELPDHSRGRKPIVSRRSPADGGWSGQRRSRDHCRHRRGRRVSETCETDRKAAVLAILIELGTECLGVHTGESARRGRLERARLRALPAGRRGEPSKLVELVRQPRTAESALAAARQVFESAGLQVALCGDFAGRIVDRLVRPYYNAALRRLDEGLASAADLDTTLKLGLGYPEGPIELLERTGLAHHYDVTQALFEAYGDPAYAPARRARVAKQRQELNRQGAKKT